MNSNRQPHRGQYRHPHRGLLENNNCATTFELSFRVVLWFLQQDRAPTAADVVARWSCNRSTAYRWLVAWRDTLGCASKPAPTAELLDTLAIPKERRQRLGLHPWRATIVPEKLP